MKRNSLLVLLVVVLCFSCSKQVKQNSGETAPISQGQAEEYYREGFVTDDLFEIVIVEPKEKIDSDNETYIKRVAKQRALVSIEKYLSSQNKIVDRNTQAAILNLIDDYGKLEMRTLEQKSRNVHTFKIEKPKLKTYIETLAKTR